MSHIYLLLSMKSIYMRALNVRFACLLEKRDEHELVFR